MKMGIMINMGPGPFLPLSNCDEITKKARNPNHIVGNTFLLKNVLLELSFFITTL
jgi:hypothetical protein